MLSEKITSKFVTLARLPRAAVVALTLLFVKSARAESSCFSCFAGILEPSLMNLRHRIEN